MAQEPTPKSLSNPELDQEPHARILDIQPAPESDGSVTFSIDGNTKSRDLLATLAYLQSDKARIDTQLDLILEFGGIKKESGNILRNRRVLVEDPVSLPTTQAKIERAIVFGDNPSFQDVRQALSAAYGSDEQGEAQTRALTLALVDKGAFGTLRVAVDHSNEIANATDSNMADEMLRLTEQFYGTDEPPTIE